MKKTTQRQICFRAWDSKKKKMLSWDKCLQKLELSHFSDFSPEPHIIPMQWVGAIEGINYFECDIVEYYKFNDVLVAEIEMKTFFDKYVSPPFRLLGNRYENPKLLISIS